LFETFAKHLEKTHLVITQHWFKKFFSGIEIPFDESRSIINDEELETLIDSDLRIYQFTKRLNVNEEIVRIHPHARENPMSEVQKNKKKFFRDRYDPFITTID